jgi:hypothetical protein
MSIEVKAWVGPKAGVSIMSRAEGVSRAPEKGAGSPGLVDPEMVHVPKYEMRLKGETHGSQKQAPVLP